MRPLGRPAGPVLARWAVLVLAVALLVPASAVQRPASPSPTPGLSSGPDGGRGPSLPPRRGGTLAIALTAPGSLDPAFALDPAGQLVVGSLFDGLTALGPGPDAPVRPAVATGWSADPALRRWEFRLDPKARFSNGAPVQAEDFKFAWERLVSPAAKPRPPGAGDLLAAVRGYRELAQGRAAGLAGVSAPDPSTLVVELTEPLADLPALVAHARLSPVPRALVARAPAPFAARPVGNGPFMLEGATGPGRSLRLVRHPGYAGPAAYLDRVRIDLVPDEHTAWLAFQEGLVQFAPVPLDQVEAARTVYGQSSDGHAAPGLLQGPAAAATMLGFNLRARPLGNPEYRLALSLAVNRERLAAALAGSAAPATGLTPHGVAGAGAAACPGCAHDPTRARQLLARLGRTPVTLHVPGGGARRRIADLVAADLAAAGVKATVVQASPAGYPGRVRDPKVQLFLFDWVAEYPRMDAVLTPRFHSRGSGNLTGLRDATVDRLLGQARATDDQAHRTDLFQQAETVILALAPVAPLLEHRHAAVLAPGFQGFDLPPSGVVDLAAAGLPS